MAPHLTPTCLWRATPELIVALDGKFGEPMDAYVNGSQVWLRDDGPAGMTIEWRLHPVPGYRRPPATDTYDLFARAALAFGTGGEPPAPLDQLWEGLEAFSAYGEEIEPAPLAAATTDALGMAPDACGIVDHQKIGDEWEASRGRTSVISSLLAQLMP